MKDILSARLDSGAFPAGSVELVELSGHETLAQLFAFEIRVVCKDPGGIDEEALLTEPAALVFSRGGHEERKLFGMVSVVNDALHTETMHLGYSLTFVPRAWRLSLTETSEIFMDLTVPEIIKRKLERAGLSEADDFELRLNGSYEPREYVVQYQETDLQFVSRLAEHLGISFFFEHQSGRDVIVFTDDNSGFHPIAGDEHVPFYARGDRRGVHRFEGTTRTIPNRYVVKDYNYRTPHLPLMATATVSGAAGGDIVEYGAHFKTPDEAQQLARIRAEELRATRRVFAGASDVQVLGAGARFTLEGHPRGDMELLLVEVRHRLQQGALGTGTGHEDAYANEFRAIPFKTAYRPPRVTPKPRVHGVITGVVEAAAKSKYAEVDETGRYHVRFLFDTSDAKEGRASRPVRMAQPHAGPGYGFHFPLRSGVEVILTCIDGDPDRPIIAGAVPNPQTPSTVEAKNAKRNVIRTGGGNEINIDDTEGEERIKISTPYGGACLQLGAPNTPESGAAMTTTDAFSQVASAGINTITTVMNSVASTMSFFAAANITNYAGVSNVLELTDKIESVAGNLLATAKSVLDFPKKYEAFEQAKLDEEVVRTEEAAKRLEEEAVLSGAALPSPPPRVQGPDGIERPMTQEEWNEQLAVSDQRVPVARAAAQSAKKAAEARKKAFEADETNVALKGVGSAVDAATAGHAALKGGRALISSASKLMKSAGDKSAAAVANGMSVGATMAASPGRVPSPVAPVTSPSCTNAALGTSAVIGHANAFVCGASNAVLASGGGTVVTGAATAVLKSPGAVEMASGVKAFITSRLVDIRATAVIAMQAAILRIEADARALIQAKALDIHVESNLDARVAGNTNIKSGGAVSIKGGSALAGDAANVSFHGTKEAELKSGGWSATLKSGQARIGGPASGCTLTNGSAVLKCGSMVTCTKDSVTVKAPSVELKGSGSIRLNGARIDLG
ncbi:type VI secretion system tip protein TssI/VgrG [Sorangium sp. So ce295]|uniref:type VI secretion system Vgr family protein n=1 Tax=Sorangium sp. So ce295 TaxID=3133295 RepID=UPI003F6211F9